MFDWKIERAREEMNTIKVRLQVVEISLEKKLKMLDSLKSRIIFLCLIGGAIFSWHFVGFSDGGFDFLSFNGLFALAFWIFLSFVFAALPMGFLVSILDWGSNKIRKVSDGVEKECATIDRTTALLGGVLEDMKKK